jgi:hypothetical protein
LKIASTMIARTVPNAIPIRIAPRTFRTTGSA